MADKNDTPKDQPPKKEKVLALHWLGLIFVIIGLVPLIGSILGAHISLELARTWLFMFVVMGVFATVYTHYLLHKTIRD